MKLFFKQKIFSWFDSYNVFDENGYTVFNVAGKLAWGHKFEIYDKDNNYLATVKQVILTLLPKYEIYKYDELIGSVNKRFSLLIPKFDLDINGWHVEGDFLNWNYTIIDGSQNIIATMHKEIFNLTDTYSIDVVKEEDALYTLIIVIIIDAIKCSNSNNN